jgi:hypothetical protein
MAPRHGENTAIAYARLFEKIDPGQISLEVYRPSYPYWII